MDITTDTYRLIPEAILIAVAVSCIATIINHLIINKNK